MHVIAHNYLLRGIRIRWLQPSTHTQHQQNSSAYMCRLSVDNMLQRKLTHQSMDRLDMLVHMNTHYWKYDFTDYHYHNIRNTSETAQPTHLCCWWTPCFGSACSATSLTMTTTPQMTNHMWRGYLPFSFTTVFWKLGNVNLSSHLTYLICHNHERVNCQVVLQTNWLVRLLHHCSEYAHLYNHSTANSIHINISADDWTAHWYEMSNHFP